MVSRLELTKATNGGWIVTEGGADSGLIPTVLAAYSTTGDLLIGLSDMLDPKEGTRTAFRGLKPGDLQYVKGAWTCP